MFKILQLNTDADGQLQQIQNQYEVDAVTYFGTDNSFNHFILVQYDTLPPSQNPVTGSVVPQDQAQAKKPAKSK